MYSKNAIFLKWYNEIIIRDKTNIYFFLLEILFSLFIATSSISY